MSARRTVGTFLREPDPRNKLEELVVDQVGDRCSARVMLSLSPGVELIGTAEGEASQRGRLRCAAEATAQAIEGATADQLELTVLAVKLVETVDTADAVIVVVALASQASQDGQRMVGSCLVQGQPDRSAVLAVLSATNRLVGPLLH